LRYDDFLGEIREALYHLNDPDYQPSEELCLAVGCDLQDGTPAFRGAVLRAIRSLAPTPGTPPNADTRQLYDLLYHRFQLKLTQEETAYRLNVSRRTINRLQHRAVHLLAGTLWEHTQAARTSERGSPLETESQLPEKDLPRSQSPDWDSQVQRELDSLQAKAPNAQSDVGEAIYNVLSIMESSTLGLGIRMAVKSIQPNLIATVHPVLLDQVLISAVKRLAPHISGGKVAVYSRLEDGNAKITLTGNIGHPAPAEEDLTRDIPISKDITLAACVEGTQAFVWIEAPSVGKLTVLAVDDNDDMARFYRDSTIGTRYHIIHITEGHDLIDTVRTLAPDIIVLDVMLPDIDGWRLLMRLREDPESRSIPVVVCSVVREEDLALSLGAACYLAKPVRPRQFIQALDRVCPQVAAGDSTAPAKSEEAG